MIRGAAETFNAFGYSGTDVRRIVAATGYATGTFYKHFTDKNAALLAAYEMWVVQEWEELSDAILTDGSPRERAERIIEVSAQLHARWRGLRQAMASYMQIEPTAVDAYRRLQRKQIAILGELRAGISPGADRPREADVLLVMLIERVVEGMAVDEPAQLGLDETTMRELLISAVADALT